MISSAISSILNTLPPLRLRKDIWTQFPVCLVRLPYSPDGHDRYAVQWHQKNLDTWCQKIPQYENITRLRLIRSLTAAEDRWAVEPPKAPGDLCVIAMKFSETPRQFDALPDLRGAADVTIQSVDDMRNFFPICWKSKNNRHTLEYHNTLVRALAAEYGVDEVAIRQMTLERLVAALRRGGWVIESTTKAHTSEICTIHK